MLIITLEDIIGLTDIDLAPERETLKEPPKRWRNWWRARRNCIDDRFGWLPPVRHRPEPSGV